MFTVMDPPERILPEDYETILAASHLVDVFAIASDNRLKPLEDRIMDAMTDEEREQHLKVARECDRLAFDTREQQILGQAFRVYLSDLYCLAALRIVPEGELARFIPKNLATPEIADTVQRYDMFTTGHLIRLAMA